MIALTRLNGRPVVVNAELIESVEQTPDCVVSLAHGKKLVVIETPEEIVDRVIEYRRKIAGAAPPAPLLARQATHHEG